MRPAGLSAPLVHLVVRGQHSVHRLLGAVIDAVVQQRGIDFGGREVHEPRRVQERQYRLLFVGAERPGAPATRPWAEHRRSLGEVVRGRGHAERLAERGRAAPGPVRRNGGHPRRSLGVSLAGRAMPSNCETFF